MPHYVGYAYALPHKTGDLRVLGNDPGIIEIPDATVVLSVFTGGQYDRFDVLENAIGLMALDVWN